MRFTPVILSSLFFLSTSIQASDSKTLLLLDDSIKHVQGNPRPTVYEAYELGTIESVTSNISIPMPSFYDPTMGFAQNVGIGVGAGLATSLIAAAVIETSLQNEQNKLIAPLRESVNPATLSTTSLKTISSKIVGSTDANVIKYYIAQASPAVLPRVLAKQKKEKVDQVYIFRRQGLPVVTLSSDCSQIIVVVEIERFSVGKINPQKNYSGKFAYTGLIKNRAENTAPLVYWTANESQNFLNEIDNAFTAMIDFIHRNPALPDKESRKEGTMLNDSGFVFQVPGKLLDIRGNNAYTIDSNDVIRIIGGQAITEHMPASEDSTVSDATSR